MALKKPILALGLRSGLRTTTHLQCQTRSLHHIEAPTPRIPQPLPFVPDAPTFLKLIGRGLSRHAAQIPSWEALFSLSGEELKARGVEPPRARRYLLWWRDRFVHGITGIGADLVHVKDGVAELRIVEVPSARKADQIATLTKSPGMRKVIINTPPTEAAPESKTEGEGDTSSRTMIRTYSRIDPTEVKPLKGFKVGAGNVVRARGIQPVKGRPGVARLKVQEGLWEQRRGHIVDGGERRKAMVRSKRRAAERKDAK